MTLEAAAWIRCADVVGDCVSDPATIVWIKENAKREHDLDDLYGNAKRRLDTYNEMVEVMCNYVREGLTVAGVFTAIRGCSVIPPTPRSRSSAAKTMKSRRSPRLARTACCRRRLRPAVGGIQMVEATDLVLRRRPLLTDSHVIVWQIGSVGDLGFNYGGYDNRNLKRLIAYLEGFYPPDTKVLHYAAALFPINDSKLSWVRLADLGNDRVTGISTLYIPPLAKRQVDNDAAVELGIFVERIEPETAQRKLIVAPVQVNARGDLRNIQPIPVPNPVASFINRVALIRCCSPRSAPTPRRCSTTACRRATAARSLAATSARSGWRSRARQRQRPRETRSKPPRSPKSPKRPTPRSSSSEEAPSPDPQRVGDSDPVETVTEVTETEVISDVVAPTVVALVEEAPAQTPQRLGDSDPVETVTEVTVEVTTETDVVDVVEVVVAGEALERGDGDTTGKA